VAGTGWVAAMTSLNVAMQLRSPEAILGRCLSLYQAITFGSMALGAWAWGWVADEVGLTFALYASAAWLAGNLVLGFFVPMPAREEGRVDIVREPAPSSKVKSA
jgi:MFS family permease